MAATYISTHVADALARLNDSTDCPCHCWRCGGFVQLSASLPAEPSPTIPTKANGHSRPNDDLRLRLRLGLHLGLRHFDLSGTFARCGIDFRSVNGLRIAFGNAIQPYTAHGSHYARERGRQRFKAEGAHRN